MGSFLKGKNCFLEERIFPLRVDSLREGKKNMKIVEFSFPESVLAHLKRINLLLEGSKLVLYM